MNPMRNIRIGKVTLNVGAGKEQTKLEKGILLLKHITGINPVKTFTNKRIPTWGLRPGLPIGCKLTLRGKSAKEMLIRLLSAKDNTLNERQYSYLDDSRVIADSKSKVTATCVDEERNTSYPNGLSAQTIDKRIALWYYDYGHRFIIEMVTTGVLING